LARGGKTAQDPSTSATAEPKITLPVSNASATVTIEQLNKMMADRDDE
jgi:hypothetical protein